MFVQRTFRHKRLPGSDQPGRPQQSRPQGCRNQEAGRKTRIPETIREGSDMHLWLPSKKSSLDSNTLCAYSKLGRTTHANAISPVLPHTIPKYSAVPSLACEAFISASLFCYTADTQTTPMFQVHTISGIPESILEAWGRFSGYHGEDRSSYPSPFDCIAVGLDAANVGRSVRRWYCNFET